MVHGDQKRLIQVISNLLNNAAKSSPEGGNIVLTMDVELHRIIIRIGTAESGFDYYLVKHVNMEQLLHLLYALP